MIFIFRMVIVFLLLLFASTFQASAVPIVVPVGTTESNVKTFGAVGDGVHDDTAAIQTACNSAGSMGGNSGIFGTSNVYSGTRTIIRFPAGVYKVSSTIVVPAYATIEGSRAILVAADDQITILSTPGYNVTIRGMVFRRGATAISVATANVDSCLVNVIEDEFIEQQKAAIKTDNNSASTALNIANCKFIETSTTAYTLDIESCESVSFRDSWVSAAGSVVYNIGPAIFQMTNILGVPYNSTGCWVKLNGGSLVAQGCRFGGEFGGKTIVKNYTAATTEYPQVSTYIIIKNCRCYTVATSYPFEFWSLPNVTVITDNVGFIDSAGIYFDPGIPPAIKKAIGTYVHFKIDDNNLQLPIAGSATNDQFTMSKLQIVDKDVAFPYVGIGDRALTIMINSTSYGLDAGGSSVSVDNTANLYGQPMELVTATRDSARYFKHFRTALKSLVAGTYTLVFETEVVNNTVELQFQVADQLKYVRLAQGKNIVAFPFVVDGAQNQLLGFDTYTKLSKGTQFKMGALRIFRGAVSVNSPNTVALGAATPTSGAWFVGDRIINTGRNDSDIAEWVCTADGSPGAWDAQQTLNAADQSFSGSKTFNSLSTSPDQRQYFRLGRHSAELPYSYISPDPTSSGFKWKNSAGADIATLDNSGNLSLSGSLQFVGGSSAAKAVSYMPRLTPHPVSASTSDEQVFSVAGLLATDTIIVNPPANVSGLMIAGVRVSATNSLAISWANLTPGILTPPAGNYRIVAIHN